MEVATPDMRVCGTEIIFFFFFFNLCVRCMQLLYTDMGHKALVCFMQEKLQHPPLPVAQQLVVT